MKEDKKIKVKFTQEYKSFSKDFEYEFEGDLIILSGLNGSGKSHLLEYIKGMQYQKRGVDLDCVSINGENISSNEIIYKNVSNACNITGVNKLNIDRNQLLDGIYDSLPKEDQLTEHVIINAINNHKYKNNILDLAERESTFDKIKKILLNYKEIKIPEKEEFINLFKEEQLLLDDDGFKSQVERIFEDYLIQGCSLYSSTANKKTDLEKKYSEGKIDYNLYTAGKLEIANKINDFKEKAPWIKLNQIFKDHFKMDFSFNYQDERGDIRYKVEMDTQQKWSINIKAGDSLLINELTNKQLKFNELSSGEKAILQLVFAVISPKNNIKILLLDEYDAVLNPSLTEIFYKILDEYFITKGIKVIIATHSITTIAMAPKEAVFYRINKPKTLLERIEKIKLKEYEEFGKHLKAINFAKELIEKIKKIEKPILLAEDKEIAIYQKAWDFFKKDFNEVDFEILPAGGVQVLVSFFKNLESIKDKNVVALFDFDEAGYDCFFNTIQKKESLEDWEENEKNNNKEEGKELSEKDKILFGCREGGYYLKRKKCNIYAMILPIPERLKDYADKEFEKTSSIEIENLLSEDFLTKTLEKKDEWQKKVVGNICVPHFTDSHKVKIRDEINKAIKTDFIDFKPIFNRINEFLNSTQNPTTTPSSSSS